MTVWVTRWFKTIQGLWSRNEQERMRHVEDPGTFNSLSLGVTRKWARPILFVEEHRLLKDHVFHFQVSESECTWFDSIYFAYLRGAGWVLRSKDHHVLIDVRQSVSFIETWWLWSSEERTGRQSKPRDLVNWVSNRNTSDVQPVRETYRC